MLSVSNLLCGSRAGHEALRYGHVRDGVTEDYGDDRFHGAPRPVVVWALTRACNLRCVHCYASASPHAAPDELTQEEAIALLDDVKAFGVPAVLFSGGEPLVRPDALELIGYARSIGLNCTLSTNGVMIDEPMADRLGEIGLRYVGISLDGIGARHDKLRGRRGAFEGTLAAIDRCRARGIKVGVRFTVHAMNESELEQMFDLCAAHDVQRLCIYHLAYAGRGEAMQKVDLTAHQTRGVVDRIFARTRECYETGRALEVLTVGNHADAGYALLQLEHEAPDRAQDAWRQLRGTGGNRSGCNVASIDPCGNVHYDQFSWHYTCGNVREQRFSTLWTEADDPRLATLRDRQRHLPRRCQSCRFLDVCNGNLRTRAEIATGDWLGLDPSCYLADEEIRLPAASEPVDVVTHTITSRVTSPPLELAVSEQAFQPNPTTVRFSRAIDVQEDDVVFDIGTGVGPLALMAAKAGARRVIGVDPVPLHAELAQRNIARYGLEETVEVHQGRFFEPFERDASLQELRADVIIGDVSGIADAAAHALGWYSELVPTGGYDGTEVIIEFLERAPAYLAAGGRVYFPVAVDLSDSEKIFNAVHDIFGDVKNALKKRYVEFPLTREQVNIVHEAYQGDPPPFIRVQDGARPHWRGQIWVAGQPRRV